MALKLYKSGQGYWTRMSSGVGAGLLVAAGIWWLWDQLSAINSRYTLYIQGAAAAILVAIFGWLIFYWVGSNPRTCDFLIATEGEMKKVNWPSRRELFGSTWVVICCTAMFATLLWLADLGFSNLFLWMKVLEK